jgi:hypothetical protein
MGRSLILKGTLSASTLGGVVEERWSVDKAKSTIVGVIIGAIILLVVVSLLTSVIKTVIEIAIVVGAVYLIARVVMKKT